MPSVGAAQLSCVQPPPAVVPHRPVFTEIEASDCMGPSPRAESQPELCSRVTARSRIGASTVDPCATQRSAVSKRI